MIGSFLRSFFWAVLFASVVAWAYLGVVRAPAREAILIEDSVRGLDAAPVKSGQWRFIPERAFPDRIHLHRVYTGLRTSSFHFKLPPLRTEILALDETFSIQIQLEVQYALDSGQLSRLFLALGSQGFADLDVYVEMRLKHLLEKELAARFQGAAADLEDLPEELESYLNEKALADFNAYFRETGVEFESLFVKHVKVPPADSYRRALARSDAMIDSRLQQIQAANEDLLRTVAQSKKDEHYFQRLEKMGGLLRRFPELRDYLAIDRLSENVDVMVVPYERWYGERGTAEKLRPPGSETTEGEGKPRRRAVLPDLGMPSGFRDLTPP